MAGHARTFIRRPDGETGPGTWEIQDAPATTRAAAYRRALNRITELDQVSREATVVLSISKGLSNLVDTSRIVVTRLERFIDAGHAMVRLRLDDSALRPTPWRSVTMVLAADDSFSARSSEFELTDGSIIRSEITYDHLVGQPVVSGLHYAVEGHDGKTRAGKTTILERSFGPVPASEFTEAKLLDGPVVHKPLPADEEVYKDPATFADWYQVPLIAAGAVLCCGFVTGLMGGFQSRRSLEPPSAAP